MKMKGNKNSHYWQNITHMARKQRAKGIKTYGKYLEENLGLTTEEVLTYLEEELIDSLMYIEAVKERIRKYGKRKIRCYRITDNIRSRRIKHN